MKKKLKDVIFEYHKNNEEFNFSIKDTIIYSTFYLTRRARKAMYRFLKEIEEREKK